MLLHLHLKGDGFNGLGGYSGSLKIKLPDTPGEAPILDWRDKRVLHVGIE